MNTKLITKILAAGVTVSAVLVSAAGTASAATIVVGTPYVAASQAKPSVVIPDVEAGTGSASSFSTEEARLLYGALEFPPVLDL